MEMVKLQPKTDVPVTHRAGRFMMDEKRKDVYTKAIREIGIPAKTHMFHRYKEHIHYYPLQTKSTAGGQKLHKNTPPEIFCLRDSEHSYLRMNAIPQDI